MTCQDCIHCTNNKCEVWERPNPRIMCDHFVNNDGSYHDGHWHCHRCGKVVEVAGLCYECEMDLYGMRHFTPEEQEIKRKAYERDSVVLNPIDDSWESVSK